MIIYIFNKELVNTGGFEVWLDALAELTQRSCLLELPWDSVSDVARGSVSLVICRTLRGSPNAISIVETTLRVNVAQANCDDVLKRQQGGCFVLTKCSVK